MSLAAIALQLLLKLKRHLKIVYSLNDDRCQVYVLLNLVVIHTVDQKKKPFNWLMTLLFNKLQLFFEISPSIQMNPPNLESFCPSRMFLLTSAKHAPLCQQLIRSLCKDIRYDPTSSLASHGFIYSCRLSSPNFCLNTQDFKSTLRDDTFDYSTYTANIKRKRPTPRKGRKSTTGGDDDDNDDDEDWGGGRRLNNSGRKGSYNRASRQR